MVSEGAFIQASVVTGYCYSGEHKQHRLTEVTRLSRPGRQISHVLLVIVKYRVTDDAGAPCRMIWDSLKFYLSVDGLHIAGYWPQWTWASGPKYSRLKDRGGQFFRKCSRVLLSSLLVQTPLSSSSLPIAVDRDYRNAPDRARARRIHLRP